MPFESKAQQKWMFVHHPKMAQEWAAKTDFSKLPEHLDMGGETPKSLKDINQEELKRALLKHYLNK
jgi:hypothetical protein